jgi:hypothetical protein
MEIWSAMGDDATLVWANSERPRHHASSLISRTYGTYRDRSQARQLVARLPARCWPTSRRLSAGNDDSEAIPHGLSRFGRTGIRHLFSGGPSARAPTTVPSVAE